MGPHVPAIDRLTSEASNLEFVWLELTNRCNLRCSHCYTESSPTSGHKDLLTEGNYLDLLDQVYDLGCRKIQFIGGEPTLNRSLTTLLQAAYEKQFEFVEVFTNLTRLSDDLLSAFQLFRVSIATSFYSHNAAIHDQITCQVGSFNLTVRNIRRVISSKLPLRVGVIIMEQNQDELSETWSFLRDLGVENIGSDYVRKFGRGALNQTCEMGELCGSCAGNILSISPDGLVAPCNMSRFWPVGSVLDEPLAEIASSPRLAALRRQIAKEVADTRGLKAETICNPKTCAPYSGCCPSTQACYPCAPNACNPCRPKG